MTGFYRILCGTLAGAAVRCALDGDAMLAGVFTAGAVTLSLHCINPKGKAE